jgi:hypothetical protein
MGFLLAHVATGLVMHFVSTRRISRALPRVRKMNLYFSILMWTTKYIYYYIACMNLEDELLLRMHAHDQLVLIERDKWMTWCKEV